MGSVVITNGVNLLRDKGLGGIPGKWTHLA